MAKKAADKKIKLKVEPEFGSVAYYDKIISELEQAQRNTSVDNAMYKVFEEKIQEYKDKFANPYVAAGYGYVDAVIDPHDTRKYLIQALDMASNKMVEPIKKKHGIPPF